MRLPLSLGFLLVMFAPAEAAAKSMTFDIFVDKNGEFRWRLRDGEGVILATSGQGYKAKADCTRMVNNLREDISKYDLEVYEDNAGKHRFRIKAKNGQTVGASNTGYATAAEAEKVVDAIKTGAKDAEVNDETKK